MFKTLIDTPLTALLQILYVMLLKIVGLSIFAALNIRLNFHFTIRNFNARSFIFVLIVGATKLDAGPCYKYSNVASDGSQCGLRSEDSRQMPSDDQGQSTNENSHELGWFLRMYELEDHTMIYLIGYSQGSGVIQIDCSTNKQPTLAYITPRMFNDRRPYDQAEMRFSVDSHTEVDQTHGVYLYWNNEREAVKVENREFILQFLRGLAEAKNRISMSVTVSGTELNFEQIFFAPDTSDSVELMQDICFS